MKHSVLALALLFISAAPGWAWDDSGTPQPAERVQQRLEEIKSRLELTPEQMEQVRPVLEEEVKELKAVQENYSAAGQNRRAKLTMARELREIQGRTDERLRQILSKEQMDEMKKIREERRAQLRELAGR